MGFLSLKGRIMENQPIMNSEDKILQHYYYQIKEYVYREMSYHLTKKQLHHAIYTLSQAIRNMLAATDSAATNAYWGKEYQDLTMKIYKQLGFSLDDDLKIVDEIYEIVKELEGFDYLSDIVDMYDNKLSEYRRNILMCLVARDKRFKNKI